MFEDMNIKGFDSYVKEGIFMNNNEMANLELKLFEDQNLFSKYNIIKEKVIEIIKWPPPISCSLNEIPPYYTDHGVDHTRRILFILDRLIEKIELQKFEIFSLLCAAWLHDIGMFVGREKDETHEIIRKNHHLKSVEYIKQESAIGRLPIDKWYLPNITDICRAHRSKVKFEDNPKIPKERPYEDGIGFIRVQLLCSLLRFADACDIHYSRAPESVFEIHKEFIPRISKEHWKKHFGIGQVRFNWNKSCIEIVVNYPTDDTNERNVHNRIVQCIHNELKAELQTITDIFMDYGITLFHVEIIDYITGQYFELNNIDSKDTIGWSLSPIPKKSLDTSLDSLIFKPILTQEEVVQCYVETEKIANIINEMVIDKFSKNYLFKSHPRTGKTSMLTYLSLKAVDKGYNVYWFFKLSNIPSFHEFIYKLSQITTSEIGTILVFDNIHEDKQVLNLIYDLLKEKPEITIWCASRICEFINISDLWDKLKDNFVEYELPGFLDKESIKSFLKKYEDLIDEEIEKNIISKKSVTPYYLVNIYTKLKENQNGLSSKEIVADIPLDVKEDNYKTFGSLGEIDRLALKIISYLDFTPKILLEKLLIRSDNDKSKNVLETLIKRKIVYVLESHMNIPKRLSFEEICIFDSFRDYIAEQICQLDYNFVLPNLLIAEAGNSNDDIPYALIALMYKYDSLDYKWKEKIKEIIFKNRDNQIILWIASNLSDEDNELLKLVDYIIKSDTLFEPKTLANFGYSLWKCNRISEAINLFENALQLHPKNSKWLHALGHCYEENDNLEQAINIMENAAQLNVDYRKCLIVLYIKNGDEENITKLYREILISYPIDIKSLNGIGFFYLNRNNLLKAKEIFETVLSTDSTSLVGLRGLSNVYMKLKDFINAISFCKKAISIEDKDYKNWSLLSNIYLEMEEFIEALETINKAIELDSNNYNHYHNKGFIYDKMGDSNNAIINYTKSLELNPDEIESYLNRGAQYYNNLNKYGLAYKDFLKAISIQPKDPLAHYSLGNVWLSVGELLLALHEYETGLSLDNGEYGENIKKSIKNINDIIDKLKKTYSDIKKNPDVFDETDCNSIAYNFIILNLFDQADELINIGLEKNPNFSYLHATKGLLEFINGNLEDGIKLYQYAISLASDDLALIKKFHYEYGKCLRMLGKYNESVSEFIDALKIELEFIPNEIIEDEIIKTKNMASLIDKPMLN